MNSTRQPVGAAEVAELQSRSTTSFAKSLVATFVIGAFAIAPTASQADEGGVSMWVPGFFGSLAAAPQVPGFAFGNLFIHSSIEGGADIAFARQVHRGTIAANFTGNLDIGIQGKADLYLAAPTYTFASPILGGQAQVALAIPYGRVKATVDATLSGNLGLGGPGFTIGGSSTNEITGFGDLAPMFNLRWNAGVNNYMVYFTGNIPVGRYDPDRLANLGLGPMGAPPTPTLIRRREMNSRPRSVSPTTSKTRIPNTRTGSTCISIWVRRSS
jgi:hypothetical protein